MPRKNKISKEDLEDQFQAFLKQSVSSDESFEAIQRKSSEVSMARGSNAKPWWLDDKDDDHIGSGLTSSGKSFLKSKSPEKTKTTTSKTTKTGAAVKAKSKQEKTRTRKKDVTPKRGGRSRAEASMSKDSLEDISEKSEEHDNEIARLAALDSSVDTRDSMTGADMLTEGQESPGKPGMDTLDELADKHRFYDAMEENGTIDYGQLNRELSQTGTTLSPTAATKAGFGQSRLGAGINDSRGMSMNDSGLSPHAGGERVEKDSGQQKPSMLSKVSLLDSLDSTLNTTTSPKASIPGEGSRDGRGEMGHTLPDTLKTRTGTGLMGTNTSKEIEALHEALREVGMSPTIRQGETTGDGLLPQASSFDKQELIEEMKRMANKENSDRTVEDIFREMTELERKVKENEGRDEDVQLLSDYRSARSHSSGSPRSHSKGISRQGHIDDDPRGFDHSHTDDTEVYNPVTAVGHKGRSLQLYSVKEKRHDDDSSLMNSAREDNKGKKSRSRYSHIQSSGYGRRSPSRSPSRSPQRSSPGKQTRPKNRTWSPAEVSRHKVAGSLSQREARKDLSGQTQGDSRLLQSVESFAHYIQNHFTGKLIPEVKQSVEEPTISSSLQGDKVSSLDRRLQQDLTQRKEEIAKLQGELQSIHRQHQEELDGIKVEHEQEMFKLKQENFVLSAKLNEGDGQSDARRKLGEVLSGDAVTREQLVLLEKEIKQQESLIAGYQTENKRLYDEMRTIKSNTRTAEEKMFAENQRLVTELTNLKAVLEQKESALRNKGIITSLAAQQQIAAGNVDSKVTANKVTQLEAELKESKRQCELHQREVKALAQTKLELDQHIHQLVRTREDLTHQLEEASKVSPEQLKTIEEKHVEEVSRLQQKLKWYAENQELLDKGAVKCKRKDEEIRELKLRLEGLNTETGRKLEENKMRAKERAGDAKKIQDLQRQVREMEGIIRRRHPNSLPALMMAAAAAPESSGAGKPASTQVLESRIHKLEDELGKKDAESDTLLRAMEQKYNNIKFKFEARVTDLEKQLSIYQRGDVGGHQVELLERELGQTESRYRSQVTDLQAEVDRLTGEINNLHNTHQNHTKNESNTQETKLKKQVTELQQELQDKKHDLHVLHTSMQKLRTDTTEDKNKKTKGKGKSSKKKMFPTENQFASFPPTELNGREYEPGTFADSDVNVILHENEELRMKVESLQLELSQQRVDLRKSLAESESITRKCRESYEDQIETLRLSHQDEVKKVLGSHALQHSATRVAQLQAKCDSQEVMVQHLQQQLAKSEVDAEQISVLKIQAAARDNQIDKLQDLLREAKKSHSPEMRHFEALQEKILQIEKRHEQRETELKQIIANTQRMASQELDQEATKWKKIVDIKNEEIQRFRAELDSILDVLRVLQKQGVVMPVSSVYT